jgi:hypothetical protein
MSDIINLHVCVKRMNFVKSIIPVYCMLFQNRALTFEPDNNITLNLIN